MIRHFADFESRILDEGKHNIVAVPCPYDMEILKALHKAEHVGICRSLLIGDEHLILEHVKASCIDECEFAIADVKDDSAAIDESFKMLVSGEVHVVAKGIVHTDTFMHGLLKYKKELLSSPLATHVAAFDIARRGLLFVSDPSILIDPTLRQKKIVIENVVSLLDNLGMTTPRIAIISSVETPTDRIPSSLDAEMLAGEFNRAKLAAFVDGPLAVDNAFSMDARRKKHIGGNVAGQADVLVVPSLDAGNILCKGLTYIGGLPSAGILAGTVKPVVLTSRSASAGERYNSLLLALATLLNGE